MYEDETAKINTIVKEAFAKYEIDYTIHYTRQQFATYIVHVSDPSRQGQSFELYFNEDLQPSMLSMDQFYFRDLSIAEGATHEDLLQAAIAILEGSFVLSRSKYLGRISAQFPTKFREASGKYRGPKPQNLDDLRRAYVKK